MFSLRLPAGVVALLIAVVVAISPAQLKDILLASREGDAPVNWALTFAACALCGYCLMVLLVAKTSPHRYLDAILAAFPAFVIVLLAARSDATTLLWSLPTLFAIVVICEFAGRHSFRSPRLVSAAVFAIGLVAYSAFAYALVAVPVALPVRIGPIPMLLLGIVLIGLLVALGVRYPLICAVYILICVGSALIWPPGPVPLLSGSESRTDENAFISWLDAREDKAPYVAARRPYPVLFASAEGGGIFAAHHALGALKAMDEQCPNFAQHLYFSAGVSGGGLGQALYAKSKFDSSQLSTLSPCNGTAPKTPPTAIRHDFLTPLIANLLIVQTFEFLTPGLAFAPDGVAVLAQSFADASGGALERPLRGGWDPAGVAPATAFVATDRESGRRYVMAPFTAMSGTGYFFPGSIDDIDLKMSQAAALGAIFPWITPTAFLDTGDGGAHVLADGGYADNSGAQTVLEIMEALRRTARDTQTCHGWWLEEKARAEAAGEPFESRSMRGPQGSVDLCQCPLVVHDGFDVDVEPNGCGRDVFFGYLTISGQLPSLLEYEEPKKAPPPSYFLDPLAAILAARERGSAIALEQARLVLTDFDPTNVLGVSTDQGLFEHVLPVADLELPLGWSLSEDRAEAIQELTADISRCSMSTEASDNPAFPTALWNDNGNDPIADANDCSLKMLAWLFNPTNAIDAYSIKGHGP